jgi:hypothetical protein
MSFLFVLNLNYIMDILAFVLWEPPTRQTDYSCLYQKVGDIYTHQVQVQVQVTLRLTVSQSVCLGVEPRPGLMTRF